MRKARIEALAADARGRMFAVPALEAAGMKAGSFFKLAPSDLIRLPETSELFSLPGRSAVGFDAASGSFARAEGASALAAFPPPGYTLTHSCAYVERGRPAMLPLFAYGACALYKGKIYVTALGIDRSRCHDSRFMDMRSVRRNSRALIRRFRSNRLVRHLARCALCYGCPNAKNFFLSRYEAPLPVSPSCNARCAGCISYRPDGDCPVTQPRIRFVPRPEEIAEVALYHIANVPRAIVSFGQGCEGEPLLASGVIERAIRLIRKNTAKGLINMNTNASLPRRLAALFDAGLGSVRVSLNSARKRYYDAYYRPRGYGFDDVKRSIRLAGERGAFVSLNYLTMPGFTDSRPEHDALGRLLSSYRIDMIQWRNLNYDPLRYFDRLRHTRCGKRYGKRYGKRVSVIGMKEEIDLLRKRFPRVKMGYFNEGAYSRRV
jgi:pyruvate-formate lyase-activating enzyme